MTYMTYMTYMTRGSKSELLTFISGPLFAKMAMDKNPRGPDFIVIKSSFLGRKRK